VQVEPINIFIKAAIDVLRQETGEEATAGTVRVQSSAQTSEEVTVMIGVTGAARGMVLLGMSQRTAKAIVSRMMGEPCPLFDDLAQSGIAEMGNVITGMAGQGLEAAGYSVTISPPALIAGGPGVLISTVNIRRFVVPLRSALGDIVLHTALEIRPDMEGSQKAHTNGHHYGLPGVLPV
jgi:chemotaxis protein CheX